MKLLRLYLARLVFRLARALMPVGSTGIAPDIKRR
jgi:hypothetical protein